MRNFFLNFSPLIILILSFSMGDLYPDTRILAWISFMSAPLGMALFALMPVSAFFRALGFLLLIIYNLWFVLSFSIHCGWSSCGTIESSMPLLLLFLVPFGIASLREVYKLREISSKRTTLQITYVILAVGLPFLFLLLF